MFVGGYSEYPRLYHNHTKITLGGKSRGKENRKSREDGTRRRER